MWFSKGNAAHLSLWSEVRSDELAGKPFLTQEYEIRGPNGLLQLYWF